MLLPAPLSVVSDGKIDLVGTRGSAKVKMLLVTCQNNLENRVFDKKKI